MIPKKLKVAGITYKVKRSKKPLVLDCAECGGIISYKKCKISIANKFNNQYMEENFCHEMEHAVAHAANVELSEDEVCRLSMIRYQVLKDNKINFK